MKISNVPGEFAFKALVKFPDREGGWFISDLLFLYLEDAIRAYKDAEIKWPVEVYEDGSVRVVSPEELEESK